MASELEGLIRAARTLSRLYARAKPPRERRHAGVALPPLFVITDPVRTRDPVALAERLPRGCGMIFRAFGAADGARLAEALVKIARRRRLILLIGAGEPWTRGFGAWGAGAHLPERMASQARRFRHPGRLVTAAAHGEAAVRRARLAGCDAVFLSKVFDSRSASPGAPMGALRFAALTRRAGLPVYALGGINGRTARALISSGAAGLAGVEAFGEGPQDQAIKP